MKKYIVDVLSNNPLCGISTYKDTLNLATGVCTRQIKKVILSGQENWGKSGSTQTFYMNPLGIDTNYKTAICDRFVYDTTGNFGTFYSPSTVNPQFNFVWDTSKTVDEWKAWLSDNPTTIWYVLAAPTSETITVPTGLSGTVEGYLIQDDTPTPTSPIYPTANPVTMWADYTPNIYNSGWTTASGQPEKYNSGWS